MFCENCGNEMGNARFCPICGAEQKSVVISTSVPAASAPIAPSNPIAPEAASIPAASAPVAPSAPIAPEATSIPAASAPVAPSAPIAPEATSIPAAPIVQAAAPTPITVVPAGVSSSPAVTVESAKPEDRKRKYTGGHIALCLITAAIMAGIAGMFAGLYFSLLWSIR